MEQIPEYRSHDFYLSVVIMAAGLPLVKLERGTGKYVEFVFADPDNKAEQIITSHWDKSLSLPTRQVVEAINELKTRLYSGV